MTHLSQLQLQDFVLGAAEPRDVEIIREHVAHCRDCAVRLQTEARFELLIQDVVGGWETASIPRANIRRFYAWRPAWVSAVFVTLAVGFWLYASRYQPSPITAEDTYSRRDYCLFVGGQADKVEQLQAVFPDSVENQVNIRH